MASLKDSGKTQSELDSERLETQEAIRPLLRQFLEEELCIRERKMTSSKKQELKNYRSQFPKIYHEIYHEIAKEISAGFNQ